MCSGNSRTTVVVVKCFVDKVFTANINKNVKYTYTYVAARLQHYNNLYS